MAQAPPILIYQPGGGVSSPIGSNPPVYSQAGTTVLVEGQEYLDVVFGSIQTNDEWVLVGCNVVNEIDTDPLNIWPGIITDRTAAGFRIYFNGLPDSGNYYLHWSVTGINIEPALAMTYLLSGPSSVTGDEVATYTVSLPPSTYVNSTVTVTPAEGGLEIGVFSPETVTLTTDSPSAVFTFIPSIYGDTTITVNNDRGLTDPADLALSVLAPTYTLEGPSGGDAGVASTDFTVELSGAVIGTVTVTPSDGGGGGVFTPTTVALTTLAPSDTFTYTPASGGTKTISVTNDGGLTNPANLSYAAVAPFSPADIAGLKGWWKADSLVLSDGDPVSAWNDSTAFAHNATQSGAARPTYKASIVNGKPVVRFVSTSSQFLNVSSSITEPAAWTIFVVMAGVLTKEVVSLGTVANSATFGPLLHPSGVRYMCAAGSIASYGSWSDTLFHVYAGTSAPMLFVDGASTTFTYVTGGVTLPFDSIGGRSGTEFSDGDIAEILIYDSILSSPDRVSVQTHLKTKYNTP